MMFYEENEICKYFDIGMCYKNRTDVIVVCCGCKFKEEIEW